MARSESLSSGRLSFLGERRLYRDAGELLLVALAFLLYFIVRANVVDRPDLALANAREVIAVERALGVYAEQSWQDASLGSGLLVRFFNFIYFWLDFPLIAVLGLSMYAFRRPQYTFTRDAILFSGAVALVCYNLLPVAPPRLVPETGMIDTLQSYNNLSYQAQSTELFVNPYAAMPSLHVGWAVLVSIGVVMAWPGNRLVLALAIVHPIAQSASTVVTGNHFFLDAVGGLAAAAAGLAFAVFMQRRGYALVRAWMGIEGNEQPATSNKG
jgi:PAP2 superfamily